MGLHSAASCSTAIASRGKEALSSAVESAGNASQYRSIVRTRLLGIMNKYTFSFNIQQEPLFTVN